MMGDATKAYRRIAAAAFDLHFEIGRRWLDENMTGWRRQREAPNPYHVGRRVIRAMTVELAGEELVEAFEAAQVEAVAAWAEAAEGLEQEAIQ